jgi:hypothetical protein
MISFVFADFALLREIFSLAEMLTHAEGAEVCYNTNLTLES